MSRVFHIIFFKSTEMLRMRFGRAFFIVLFIVHRIPYNGMVRRDKNG